MLNTKNSKTWIYILAIAVVALLIFVMVKNKDKKNAEEVLVENAQLRTIKETVSASGKIFPETEIKISSDVSGEVVELYVQEGDTVKAGQLLARVDADQYVSAVERGEATVNSAKSQQSSADSGIKNAMAILQQIESQKEQVEAQVENAREVYKRNQKLLSEGVIAQAEFDIAKTNLSALEANLKSATANVNAAKTGIVTASENAKNAGFNISGAQASLKEVKTSLRKTSIISRTNGIVSKMNIEKGERVVGTLQMAGTELMRIAQMNTMEVQVDVSENDILRLKVGNPASIEVDAYSGRKFAGVVTEISNSASNVGSMLGGVATNLSTDQVTNFVVKVRIDPNSYSDLMIENRKYPFLPGMSASVDITTNTIEKTLSVPIQSVTTRDGTEEKGSNGKPTETNDDVLKTDLEKKLESGAKTADLKEVVFVMSGDTVKMVEVKTGIQDDEFIQVLSGVKEGEKVITGPYNTVARKLNSGDSVKLKKEDKIE